MAFPVADPEFKEVLPGNEVKIDVQAQPSMWVGENTDVNVKVATANIGGFTTLVQPFPKRVAIDRSASLLLFDANGKEVPNSTILAQAGRRVTFLVAFKYLKDVALPGPFAFRVASTSQPDLVASPNTTTGVNYGAWSPNMKADVVSLSFDVPNTLKGKTGWITITLLEGSQIIHDLPVYLNVN